MDCFKLHMCQRGLEKHRHRLRFIVQKKFQRAHALNDLYRRRGNKGRVPRARAADPVLTAPEFSRCPAAVPSFGQQDAVHFAEQAQGHGESRLQQMQAVAERGDIIADLLHIIERNSGLLIQFEQQQIREGRLGALDHGREHRFLADIHVQQQGRVGQQGRNAVQASESQQGLVEFVAQGRCPVDRGMRRQWRGHKWFLVSETQA